MSDKNKELTSEERASLLIDYWKQTSNVQQHFNDISMKVRNFAVVVFSGFLTGVGLSIHNDISVSILGADVSAGVIFALAGMIATQLIHFMDTYWYHVFLKGAVSTSVVIEKEINQILNIPKLSDSITQSSHKVYVIAIFGLIYLPIGWKDCLKKYYKCRLKIPFTKTRCIILKRGKVDSSLRHKVFYRWLLFIFIITAIACAFSSPKNHKNINPEKKEKPSIIQVYNIIPFPKPQKENESPIIDKEIKQVRYIISGSNVRTREQPNLNSKVLTLLPIGKEVDVIKFDRKKKWANVSFSLKGKKIYGWIYSYYVRKEK